MRNTVLIVALAFIAVLAGLTITVAIRNGPDILTIGSILVLAMFGFGIVGALGDPEE